MHCTITENVYCIAAWGSQPSHCFFFVAGLAIGLQTTYITVNEDAGSVSVCASVLEPSSSTTSIPGGQYRVRLTTSSSSAISGKRELSSRTMQL